MSIDEKETLMNRDIDVYQIVATDESGGMGYEGEIPWKGEYPEDLFLFEKITKGHSLIMGRKTFDSLSGPLSRRVNIVMTKKEYYRSRDSSLFFEDDLNKALSTARIKNENHDIYIIGGQSVYEQTFDKELLTGIFHTEVEGVYDHDVRYPIEKLSEVPLKQEIFMTDNKSAILRYHEFGQ